MIRGRVLDALGERERAEARRARHSRTLAPRRDWTPAPPFRRNVSSHVRGVVTSMVGLGLLLSAVGAGSAQTEQRDAELALPLGAPPAAVSRFCVDRARRATF